MKIDFSSIFKIIPRYDKYMDPAKYKFEILLTDEEYNKEGLHHSSKKAKPQNQEEDFISEVSFDLN